MKYTREQDPKCSREPNNFTVFFYAFEFKEGTLGRLHEGGRKQGGKLSMIGLQNS